MNTYREVEKWFAKNQQRFSERCPDARMGKTHGYDSGNGWVWITLEAGSRIMQIRVLSSGEIEGALWDEASSQETDFDSEVSPTVELSEILDGFLRKLLGE